MSDSTVKKITRLKLHDGEAGVRQTLKLMGRLVREYRANPTIYGLARSLIQKVPQKSWRGEVDQMFYFVRDDIRYVKDPVGAEAVQLPTITLSIKSGDCDDKVTLLSSLLESAGHPTRFCAVKVDGKDRYSHVFLQTKIGKSWWVSLETTEPWPSGKQSPRISGKMLVFYPR